ncbi:MAG: DsbA family protein [Chloroflexi bacterium]|nr:DsbA family protein [Chloroflexota bacterium]
MGLERVERLKQEYPVDVEWRPFDLRPGTPPEGTLRTGPDVGQVLGGHLGAMAKEAGLLMRRPPLTACSRPTMAAGEYAKEQGKYKEFHLAMFKAYWEDGRNIGDLVVIRQVAEVVGLPWLELEGRLSTGFYTPKIEAAIAEAHRIGINAIPAFIVGQYFFMGAQPYEVFREVVELVLKEGREQA